MPLQTGRSLRISEMPWSHSVEASSWARAGSPLGCLMSATCLVGQIGFLDSRWLAEAVVERDSPAGQQDKEKDFKLLDGDRCGQPLHRVEEQREWITSLFSFAHYSPPPTHEQTLCERREESTAGSLALDVRSCIFPSSLLF